MRKTSLPATVIPWRSSRSGRAANGDDASYHRQRALEEQAMAERATCDAARECHEELAAMYRLRAAMVSTHPQYRDSPALEQSPQAA